MASEDTTKELLELFQKFKAGGGSLSPSSWRPWMGRTPPSPSRWNLLDPSQMLLLESSRILKDGRPHLSWSWRSRNQLMTCLWRRMLVNWWSQNQRTKRRNNWSRWTMWKSVCHSQTQGGQPQHRNRTWKEDFTRCEVNIEPFSAEAIKKLDVRRCKPMSIVRSSPAFPCVGRGTSPLPLPSSPMWS